MIGARVPVIYDPSTTFGSVRTPFANNTIPLARMDPVALALLQRYPLPTSSGTANNYRRTDNEVDNQDQWDARIDHTFSSNRDHVFGRLSYFRDGFVPVTPLTDGSGATSGTLGSQDTRAWAFASNYQHTFSANLLNELRIGDTRRRVGRTAAQLSASAGAALSIPGIPSTAKFPNTLPTFFIGGYQQLGSPQRTLDNITPAFVLQNGPSVAPIAPTATAGLGQGVFAVDGSLGSGYVQQWNVSVQRELTGNTSLETAYVGSNITHVGIPDSNLNQLSVDQLALKDALTQRVPNPYFGVIPPSSSLGDPTIPLAQLLKPYPAYTTVSLYRNNVGTTRYQAFELSLRQRLAHGLSYSVAYTRSKLVDDASSVFDASILTGPTANYPVADSFNRTGERDYSTGDIPHVFVSSVVWDLPIGAGRATELRGVLGAIANDWAVTSLVTLQSGSPVAVTQTTNFNAFAGFGVQRPNLAGDPTLPASQRTPSQWFNTARFTIAPPFTVGSASRNPVRGPSYRNVDVALMRRVPLNRQALEVRVEIFNLLNTVNLGTPNAVAGVANFGTITTAFDPRIVQLAVRFLF